jgi:hypothetical protein
MEKLVKWWSVREENCCTLDARTWAASSSLLKDGEDGEQTAPTRFSAMNTIGYSRQLNECKMTVCRSLSRAR